MTTFNPYTLDKIERAMQSPRRHSLGRGKADAKADPVNKAARAAGGFARGLMDGARGRGNPVERSARIKGTLARMVAKTPEVMVKVTGRQNGAGHTLDNFSYISRLGWGDDKEIPLETSEGQTLTNGREMQQLAREWQAWEQDDEQTRRKGSTSLSMVLSMPAGTDPDKLKAAALDFAREEMGNRRWVLALHNDTDHVHCHLTIARRDDDGRRFNPNREDLARYRELFAEKLRDRGIAANATPQRARGVTRKNDHWATVARRERGEVARADSQRKERLVERVNKNQLDTEADSRASHNRMLVLDAFKDVAVELMEGEQADKRLALDLVQFAKEMPTALSRDSQLVHDAVKTLEERARQADRSPDDSRKTPDQSSPQPKGPDKSGPER